MGLARKLSLSIAAAAAALALMAPAGQAITTQATATIPCPDAAIETPFMRWSDTENYWLTPGGAFEPNTPKWSLANAKVVSGNETYKVHSLNDANALSLADKSSALSPVFCLRNNEPTLRFFVRSGKVDPTAVLQVELLFDIAGTKYAATVALFTATSTTWQPSTKVQILVNQLASLSGDIRVQLRFKATGKAGWWIDDVYVDPKRR
jgi:hypothetical protein